MLRKQGVAFINANSNRSNILKFQRSENLNKSTNFIKSFIKTVYKPSLSRDS